MDQLAGRGGLLVALSGGVDSAVLLALAIDALGRRRVVAATGRSPSLAAWDLEQARVVARHLDARHELIPTREMGLAAYRANLGDRCLHCRSVLFEALGGLARERGLDRIAYGAIADDLGDVRPGMRAAERLGILAPLLRAGLRKDDVRALALEAGLPVADRPASACLASRIPAGTEVTPERLAQVEHAEAALRELGFGQLRVRHHGEAARLEFDREGLARLADPGLRARTVRAVRAAGYRRVSIDPAGYRQGGAARAATAQRTRPARDSGQ